MSTQVAQPVVRSYGQAAQIREALRGGASGAEVVKRLVQMGWPEALAWSEVRMAAAAQPPRAPVRVTPVPAPVRASAQNQPTPRPAVPNTDALHDTNFIEPCGHRVRVVLSAGAGACHLTVLEDAITDAEIEHLVATARPKLERATVVADDAKDGVDSRRTSDRCWLNRACDPVVAGIEKRLSAMTGIPEDHGEGLQILHYAHAQEYQPHYDYFSRSTQFERDTIAKSGNRIGTLILYLADTEAGGCTYFPVLDISVHPRRGAAMWFAYLPSGNVDPRSQHGGTPIVRGEKWIATKWFRERAFLG
ncbi:MAG TPA: 2OG-Fe(II) oxygenase [Nevskiaceae bacterium]|nr:2OG-Fe(II) oxygenase [Nevskiaceae bacterium]